MPLYMDLHILPGVKAKEVAEAHRRDMLIQNDHSCKCMTYWIDEKRGNVFCLIDAPSKEAVETMHSKAHGLVPNKIIEVDSSLVESFLGRISDPEDAAISEGLKIFSDPSFRILIMIRIGDPVLLHHKIGKQETMQLLKNYTEIIKGSFLKHSGSEIEYDGHDFIASFVSAGKATSCSLEIQKKLSGKDDLNAEFKIAISSGEPVAENAQLFGDALQLADRMFAIAKNSQVILSSEVKGFIAKDHLNENTDQLVMLSAGDEELLRTLFSKLEENWQDTDFNIDDYCTSIGMSKSQLYRKTVALTGLSPNSLLKEFRLENARTLLKKKHLSISEVTFNSGFTSPSYFTKCFKKKFGITPNSYLDLI
jgi:AraC-like DNA-binding protein